MTCPINSTSNDIGRACKVYSFCALVKHWGWCHYKFLNLCTLKQHISFRLKEKQKCATFKQRKQSMNTTITDQLKCWRCKCFRRSNTQTTEKLWLKNVEGIEHSISVVLKVKMWREISQSSKAQQISTACSIVSGHSRAMLYWG